MCASIIRYEWEGENYDITEGVDMHEKLQGDPTFFEIYIHDEENAANIQKATEKSGTTSSSEWSKELTMLFLAEYKERIEDFRDPKKKKKDLWRAISKQLGNHGYQVTEMALDRKMRNMRATYRSIKDSNRMSGRGRTSWTYLECMEDIFAQDKCINFSNPISAMGEKLRKEATQRNDEASNDIVSATIDLTEGPGTSRDSDKQSREGSFPNLTSSASYHATINYSNTPVQSINEKITPPTNGISNKSLTILKNKTQKIRKSKAARELADLRNQYCEIESARTAQLKSITEQAIQKNEISQKCSEEMEERNKLIKEKIAAMNAHTLALNTYTQALKEHTQALNRQAKALEENNKKSSS